MSTAITRTVRLLSRVHKTTDSILAGEKTVEQVARKKLFSPQYFPAFLAVSMTASGVAGFYFMENLRRNRLISSS